MRISSKARLLAAVFGSGVMLFAAGAACAETLADAIALAYATNPQLLQQRSGLRNQDEAYFRAERSIGPSVAATITVSGNTDNDLVNGGSGEQVLQTSGSISATQPIYSGGRLTSTLAAQEATLLAARENLRTLEMNVLSSVVEAYNGVRRANEALDITSENVKVLQRQKDEAQTRFEVGASTRTDVAQAESRLASARGSLTTAQNTLDNARAQYRAVVGKSPETLAPAPDLTSLLPPSQAIAFTTAEQSSPGLRAAYLNERVSAANIANARGARRPTINFTTGLTARNTFYPSATPSFLDPDPKDYSAGFTTGATLSIPLYVSTITSSQIRTAQENNTSSNIAIESQRRALNQTVTTNWNALISARSQIVSQTEAVRASQLAFEGTREEQQVGLRTTLDLLNAEQELRSSQLNLINARFTEYTAQVALLNAMGKLAPETFGAQVEKYDVKKHLEEIDYTLPWEPLIKTIDRVGAPPIPVRQPLPGENVPSVEPLR